MYKKIPLHEICLYIIFACDQKFHTQGIGSATTKRGARWVCSVGINFIFECKECLAWDRNTPLSSMHDCWDLMSLLILSLVRWIQNAENCVPYCLCWSLTLQHLTTSTIFSTWSSSPNSIKEWATFLRPALTVISWLPTLLWIPTLIGTIHLLRNWGSSFCCQTLLCTYQAYVLLSNLWFWFKMASPLCLLWNIFFQTWMLSSLFCLLLWQG